MYLVVLAVAVLMFWLARNLLDSRTGRALTAIRDHPMAANTMGINLAQYKAITFGISALYTGVAGALLRASSSSASRPTASVSSCRSPCWWAWWSAASPRCRAPSSAASSCR